MPELTNDPEELAMYAALRVELMHKWYLTLVKAINKTDNEEVNKTEQFDDLEGNK